LHFGIKIKKKSSQEGLRELIGEFAGPKARENNFYVRTY